MVPDYLVDDEAQKFLAEFRVQIGILGQLPEPRNLFLFPCRICGGQGDAGLVFANRLRDPKPFRQYVHQRRVDIVDAFAIGAKHRIISGVLGK